MKKLSVLIVLTALIGTFNLHAGFSCEIDFVSSYMWRGWDMHNKRPALQPSITYVFGDSGFSVNLWATYVLDERALYKEDDEVDLTINYDFQVSENFSLSVGMINYSYPYTPGYTFKNGNSQEFYATVGFPRVFLGPAVSVYYDINLGKGLYAEFSLGHSFPFSDKTSLELSASIGYNEKLYIDESGISDLNISAAVPFSVGKLNITPSVNYTRVYLEPLYYEDGDRERIWFGLNVGIN